MSWFRQAPESIAVCPNCKNEDLLLIGKVSRATRGDQVRDTRSGNVYRCPLCECAFFVTVAGVWRMGASRRDVPTVSNTSERKPGSKYPALDPDLSVLMDQREP